MFCFIVQVNFNYVIVVIYIYGLRAYVFLNGSIVVIFPWGPDSDITHRQLLLIAITMAS